ncbi:MAG: hypothetical protein M3N29_08895, partial [Chloroflexota bacterium]|nr:hypothetical protein [Chloroflexota bacterium]
MATPGGVAAEAGTEVALATRRWVEVAIDAAGPAGAQTWTYHVPPSLPDLVAGEAVLVEYGRRQALGIVLGDSSTPPERETKPVLARVRSEGPLLPPLQIELARFISRHYLAPPALVMRAMLGPGALERIERVTSAGPDGPVSEWRIRQPPARERQARFVRLADSVPAGAYARLGPRQQALLAELARVGDALPATDLA